jgi:hypothetical protein
MREDFETQLARARAIEEAVARWCMRRGGMVLPVYDYSGLQDNKAPRLQGLPAKRSLVLPDLLVFRSGRRWWLEVKLKTETTATKIRGGRPETGIDLRHWRHYAAVQLETGIPVWVLFVHEREAEVRGASIDELTEHARLSPNFNGGKGGMFFAWDSLHWVCDLDSVLAEAA